MTCHPSRVPLLSVTVLLGAILGCDAPEPSPGTGVGNPGAVALAIGSAEGFRFVGGEVAIERLSMLGCSTPEGKQEDGVSLSAATLHFDPHEALEVRSGTWCGLQLEMASRVALYGAIDEDDDSTARDHTTGHLPNGDDDNDPGADDDDSAAEEIDLEIYLTIETLVSTATDAFAIDGERFVYELGEEGWLSLDELGGQAIVGGDTGLHQVLVNRIIEHSALYADTDADGRISADERAAGPLTD
ncbi:MAG TPA: hypothetical protein DIU15_15880 [Deltaproteobacteria bacterium]|nr:hypothetical protein [Deltaproteobacteria bacterium]HCP47521.1 hypothetical protein [Deltaproteobacteria bacterium]